MDRRRELQKRGGVPSARQVQDFSHAVDVYAWAKKVDGALAELRSAAAENHGAENEDWRVFMSWRADMVGTVHQEGFMMPFPGTNKRVRAKGITKKMLNKGFWPGRSGDFHDVKGRKRRSDVQEDGEPSRNPCGTTGMTHGNHVHTQIESIIKHLVCGHTVVDWLQTNPRNILDPCTAAAFQHLVFHEKMYPVGSEMPVYDDKGYFWTKIDMLWRSAADGCIVAWETKTGYGAGGFAVELSTDRHFLAPLKMVVDTPLNRAVLQICMTDIMLEQRYKWAPDLRVLHLDRGKAASFPMPSWVFNEQIRSDIYLHCLKFQPKVARDMYAKHFKQLAEREEEEEEEEEEVFIVGAS